MRPHRLRQRIAQAYRQRSPHDTHRGRHWYPAARRLVSRWARRYQLPRETVACVIAAISPQCDWPTNKRLARAILNGRDPASLSGALRVNLRKAWGIRATRAGLDTLARWFPTGSKVQAFARNLAGDDHQAITIDRHAASAAYGRPMYTLSLHPARYRVIAEAYRTVARELGVPPAQLQAIIWVSWRRKHGRLTRRARG